MITEAILNMKTEPKFKFGDKVVWEGGRGIFLILQAKQHEENSIQNHKITYWITSFPPDHKITYVVREEKLDRAIDYPISPDIPAAIPKFKEGDRIHFKSDPCGLGKSSHRNGIVSRYPEIIRNKFYYRVNIHVQEMVDEEDIYHVDKLS